MSLGLLQRIFIDELIYIFALRNPGSSVGKPWPTDLVVLGSSLT